ncbi:MAG: hypothetical protein KFH87_09020 [Bacteroidetes bacterium]|nr:hypothetical protein [Bacteroidota bacterium]
MENSISYYRLNPHGVVRCAAWSVLLLATILLVSCGNEIREIPKEETGEPTTLPVEALHYREAREVFMNWIRMFEPGQDPTAQYQLLSAASRRSLREHGISDATAFSTWFLEKRQAGTAPFSYALSRFDVLDIELQDSTRALLTASFLVHRHQNTFESIGTFVLKRETGSWVVPFAERGDYESGWWEKEHGFAMRLQEEGLLRLASDSLSLDLHYPVAWDIVSGSRTTIPPNPSPLPGIEMHYVDPTVLTPVAFVRIAVLSEVLPDSLYADSLSHSDTTLRLLRTERVKHGDGSSLEGEVQRIADTKHNRILLFYTAVDRAHSRYEHFAETFTAMRKSLNTKTEVLP